MDELIRKAKDGDDEAFDELILSIRKELYLIAKTKLSNDDDIADSISETILICYKNIKKLKHDEYFKTWIIRILINECKKTYKRNKKRNLSIEDNDLENYIVSEEKFENNLSFDIVIKDLNDEEKLILTLFYCSEYTTKEISKILNKNENTIRSKISRAKNKLRRKYETYEGGDK